MFETIAVRPRYETPTTNLNDCAATPCPHPARWTVKAHRGSRARDWERHYCATCARVNVHDFMVQHMTA